MESILTELKSTPIPTILVVAGIVFLLLSIAGQLAGRITVPPEQRRQATIMGYLLVVVGVALHVVPLVLNRPTRPEAPPQTIPPPAIKPNEPSPTPTLPPGTPLPPPIPQPTTQDFNVVSIPSLNARLTALRFFEGDPCDEQPKERTYRQRFAQVITRDVFTEITLEYPKREQRLNFTIEAVYQRKTPQDGEIIGRPESKTYLPADEQRSMHSFHSGSLKGVGVCGFWHERRGRLSVGSYTVNVYINGEPVTSGSFEIHE